MDLITVIIPYFKKKKYIAKTLKSVTNQSYKKIEVILLYDETSLVDLNYIKNLVKKDKRIRLLINKKNLGAGLSRNKGIKHAKGKYISFLDADDLWKSKKLERQLEIMKLNKFDITHTSYEIIGKNGQIIGYRNARNFKNINSLLKSCDIGLSTVIIRKSIFKKNDIFPNIKTKEDFVFWLNLLNKNKNIYGINKKLSKWRKLDNSLSSSILQKLKDGFRVYNKFMKMSFMRSIYYLILLSANSIIKKFNQK